MRCRRWLCSCCVRMQLGEKRFDELLQRTRPGQERSLSKLLPTLLCAQTQPCGERALNCLCQVLLVQVQDLLSAWRQPSAVRALGG